MNFKTFLCWVWLLLPTVQTYAGVVVGGGERKATPVPVDSGGTSTSTWCAIVAGVVVVGYWLLPKLRESLKR